MNWFYAYLMFGAGFYTALSMEHREYMKTLGWQLIAAVPFGILFWPVGFVALWRDEVAMPRNERVF